MTQPLNFVIDARLPPILAECLQRRGHTASPVRDLGLKHADDKDIWAYAAHKGDIIVTKVEDFANLAAALPEGPCVRWIRSDNLVVRHSLQHMARAWPEAEAHLRARARVVEVR